MQLVGRDFARGSCWREASEASAELTVAAASRRDCVVRGVTGADNSIGVETVESSTLRYARWRRVSSTRQMVAEKARIVTTNELR